VPSELKPYSECPELELLLDEPIPLVNTNIASAKSPVSSKYRRSYERQHFRTESNHDNISYLFEGVGSSAKLVGQPGQQRSVVLVRRKLASVQQFEQRPEERCVDARRAQLQAYPCSMTRESTQNLKINQPVTALGSVQ
jgi:hypothetical protein